MFRVLVEDTVFGYMGGGGGYSGGESSVSQIENNIFQVSAEVQKLLSHVSTVAGIGMHIM